MLMDEVLPSLPRMHHPTNDPFFAETDSFPGRLMHFCGRFITCPAPSSHLAEEAVLYKTLEES